MSSPYILFLFCREWLLLDAATVKLDGTCYISLVCFSLKIACSSHVNDLFPNLIFSHSIEESKMRQSMRWQFSASAVESFDIVWLFFSKVRWNECESEYAYVPRSVCTYVVYVETFQWNRLLIRHKLRNYAFMAKYYSSILFSSLHSTNIDAVALMLVFFTLHIHTHTYADTHMLRTMVLWLQMAKI